LPLRPAVESVESAQQADGAIPLCVDLDGTLIKSDSLYDGFCQFARTHPLELGRVPLWVLGGKARLKREIAARAPLDVARLPYNTPLLSFLQTARRKGRGLYLATGADSALAERVAEHLGIFAGVLASDGVTNLTHGSKLRSLQERFGTFDYIGNARADLPLLAAARTAMVANPTLGLRAGLRRRAIPVAQVFRDQRPMGRTLVKAIRIHQWAKNLLLFLPLLLSHHINARGLIAALAAFSCFSFIDSGNYLVNGMLDIESDRHYPGKRLRPFAAGDLAVTSGFALAAALVLAAVALLPLLPAAFALWMGVYVAATLSYSLYLKQVAIVDVLLLAGLYMLQLLAGGAATGTPVSHWLAGFSILLFLSLAMVKRYGERENLRARTQQLYEERPPIVRKDRASSRSKRPGP
jgi:hypothetical protein